ncbi:unnamed protein product [Paramecium pentaurelia]|uniref:Uncharacterized protein n=1 Tax=Paramecium pentaurelia TaxID=43138 RepID=A0A8S1YQD1_9CILI|nr:unnamed protein product [Paramecium pentaurelia]
MTSFGALLVTFAMNYQMIAIGLFFLGFGGNPTITVHYSFINEHSCNLYISKILYRGQFREVQNVGVQVFFAIDEFAIIALAYFITYWRWLAVSVAIPSILLNIGNLLIFESPQFLYTKNKKNVYRFQIKLQNQMELNKQKQMIWQLIHKLKRKIPGYILFWIY